MSFYLSQSYASARAIIDLSSAFSCMNCNIHFYSYSTLSLRINSQQFYSLFNATIHLRSTNTVGEIQVHCDEYNPQNFKVSIDANSSSANLNFSQNCNIIHSIDEIDNRTLSMIQELSNLVDLITVGHEDWNGTNNDSDLVFDIGYSIYAETSIANEVDFASITCYGYQSCAAADIIKTSMGYIFCLGSYSCASSNLIWTDDSNIDSITLDASYSNDNYIGSIFCAAPYSCSDSVLDSSNVILCGCKTACDSSVISSARQLYCTTKACTHTIIRSVETVYFIDEQIDCIIYSSNIGETTTYFQGANSGKDVIYYCNQGDICNIVCSDGACNSTTTVLYCYGKCFVECGKEFSNGSTDCVEIVTSTAPTAVPTVAPTGSPSVPPTVAPTDSPTIGPTSAPSFQPSQDPTLAPSVPPSNSPSGIPSDAPTIIPTNEPSDSTLVSEEEISLYFNYILIVIAGVTICLVIMGIIDAKKRRRNELFKWVCIYTFAFYSNDFLSDVFFCMKLYVLTFDGIGENDKYYFILFILSCIFLIAPLISNILQLHFEISKWQKDTILRKTGVSNWIKSNVRLLYFVSVISGSSFSAISLCNSYLFQLSVFSMGLSKYHQSIFQNKRFYSVVLLEVEYNYTLFNYNYNYNYSDLYNLCVCLAFGFFDRTFHNFVFKLQL